MNQCRDFDKTRENSESNYTVLYHVFIKIICTNISYYAHVIPNFSDWMNAGRALKSKAESNLLSIPRTIY